MRYKILLGITVVLIVVSQSFSPFVKSYITSHSEEWFGSQMEIGKLHFNILNTSFSLKDVQIYEPNSKKVFAGVKKIHLDFSPWKLMDNEYFFTEVLLDGVALNISKNDNHFNFETIFQSLYAKDDSNNTEPVKYTLRNIQIINSQINFLDLNTNNELKFENVQLKLPELAWNTSESKAGLNFNLGKNGRMHIEAHIDEEKDKYRLQCKVEKFDLSTVVSYLQEYFAIKELSGDLNFEYTLEGSLSHIDDIKISGNSNISNLIVYDKKDDVFASVKSIEADLFYYKPTLSAFYFRSIKLIEPRTQLIFDEESNNWSWFLGLENDSDNTENSTINYIIRLLSVENGTLLYRDKRITPHFETKVDHINCNIKNIGNQEKVIAASYSGDIHQGGSISGTAQFSILNSDKWEVHSQVKDLPLVNYSNFSQHYLSRPVLNGQLTYDFYVSVNRNDIVNQNRFSFSNPIFGEKLNDKPIYQVPVRSAFSLLKDKNNVVAFEIPVKGNTSDPGFSLSEEIKRAVKEYLVSTAKQKVKKVGQSISELTQKMDIIQLKFGESKVPFRQLVILSKVADRVKFGEVRKLVFIQTTNVDIEKEYLALQEAKVLYLKSNQPSLGDNENMLNIKLKLLSDSKPALIRFINEKTSLPENATVNQKCIDIVGKNRMDALVLELMNNRNDELSKYLKDKLKLEEKSFEIKLGNISNVNQISSPQYEISEILGGEEVKIRFEEDF